MGAIENINSKFLGCLVLFAVSCAFDYSVTGIIFGAVENFQMTSVFNITEFEEADGIIKELVEKLDSPKWKFYDSQNGDMVYAQEGNNRVKLIGALQATPQTIITILFDQFEKTQEWNKDIENSKILERINSTSDIVYQRTKKMYMVDSRNFFFYRHLQKFSDKSIILAWNAFDYKQMNLDGVKAIYETSGWRIKRIGNEVKSHIEVLVDADLNLNAFLSRFAKPGFSNGLFGTVNYLRKRLGLLKDDLKEPIESFEAPF